MQDKGDEREILVESVEKSFHDKRDPNDTSSSINKQDIAIDQFLDANTNSNIDS